MILVTSLAIWEPVKVALMVLKCDKSMAIGFFVPSMSMLNMFVNFSAV